MISPAGVSAKILSPRVNGRWDSHNLIYYKRVIIGGQHEQYTIGFTIN